MVSLPILAHVLPSAEMDAVTTLPARWSRTHRGAAPAPAAAVTELAPEDRRRWNASPLPIETNIDACAEPAADVARIMTPALVHASVPVSAATRATIVPSPLIVR